MTPLKELVHYGPMIGDAWRAVQEMERAVDALKRRLWQLQTTLQALEER